MTDIPQQITEAPEVKPQSGKIAKMVICSLIGIFSFFISFEWNGKSTILIDHIVTWVQTAFPSAVTVYVFIGLVAGALYPFIKGK